MKCKETKVSYIRKTMVKEKSDCEGCEDNFYNGNNPHGTKECWKFSDAKIIMRKQVHINQTPPWTQKPTLMMSCYRKKQFVFVNGNTI